MSYVYGTANQLVRENNQAAGTTTVWNYDNAGNILTFNNGSRTHAYTYGDSAWGDLLTTYDGQTISYDAIGNPTSYYNGTRWTLGWEHGRELATISDGTTTWTNTYNADGLRIKRTNGTKTYEYIYLGDKLIQMTVGDDVLKFGYDAGGSPMYLQYNNSRYFYATNVQGDVMALVHTNGTAVVQYTYDAWGNILTTTGSMASTLGQINPLRYRGYVYDTETELYYLQSRYYDPAICRWINADDTAYLGADGTLLSNNLFAYCGNNPANKIDKTGNLGLAIGLFIGASAVIGGLAGAFTAACTGGNILEGVLEGAALGAVAATATVFVPQLIAPLATTVAATVTTTTAAQATVAAAVTTGATFIASGFLGMAVDGATQWISHEMGGNSNEEFELAKGRVYKTGLTTGIAGVIPTYGDPAKAVVNAIGSLVMGFDASFVNAAIEIAVTKLNG